MILLYQYLVSTKTIDHKFPVVGHSYLDSERDFGRIEKDHRRHGTIYLPLQYMDIISKSNKNNLVVDMTLHFRDLENLKNKLNLKQSKTDLLEEIVRFRDGLEWKSTEVICSKKLMMKDLQEKKWILQRVHHHQMMYILNK